MTEARRANFDRLYAAVMAMIRDGQFRSGDRIGVKDLSMRLKVSPTPLREVLSRLVGREIVEERRSEGYYVARLDARDIADLYRLHLSCLDLLLRTLPPREAPPAPPDATVWDRFDLLALASKDRILSGVQRYLADRLMLLRRCETLHFADLAEDARLRAQILEGQVPAELRQPIRSFHKLRWKTAQDLALLLGRG